MRNLARRLLAALLLTLLVLPLSAHAQTAGDRLERLERDMLTVQQFVFQGKTPPSSSMPMAGGDAAGYEVRLQELTQQLQLLTGQVEELRFRMDQAVQRLNTLQSDMDFRLQRLEQGGAQPMSLTPPLNQT
jgi:TolA-binding protein